MSDQIPHAAQWDCPYCESGPMGYRELQWHYRHECKRLPQSPAPPPKTSPVPPPQTVTDGGMGCVLVLFLVLSALVSGAWSAIR